MFATYPTQTQQTQQPKFNFVSWTSPRGHAALLNKPAVRVTKHGIRLNKESLALLPQGTTHVDLGIDIDNRCICIRQSNNCGRKLTAKTNAPTYITFSCVGFAEQYPDVEQRVYDVQSYGDMIIFSY